MTREDRAGNAYDALGLRFEDAPDARAVTQVRARRRRRGGGAVGG